MTFDQLTRVAREAGFVAANDNFLDAAFDKPEIDTDDAPAGPLKIYADMTPEERMARREADRNAAEVRRKEERARMAPVRAALAKRQAKGNPSADNDNENWPLLTALKREGDNDSVALVLAYRKLAALAACQPLQGQRMAGGEPVVHRQTNLSAQTERVLVEAQAKGWTGTSLPGGEFHYKEVKKRKGGTFHLPAQQAVVTNDETRVCTAPLALPFSDELLLRQIDAKPVLDHVRKSLGPLQDILDDAVLGSRSYTEIGRRKGAKAKPDEAGRVLVKWAILIAEDALHNAGQIIRRAEKKSERRAAARRIELELEQARYLNKAA
jgi:hypothetical protein